MNDPVPSPRRPIFRRCFAAIFSWKKLRYALLAAVGLTTFVALVYAVENWRGRRAWQKFTLSAPDAKTQYATLAPPAVPDGENFAMTPLLKPLFELTWANGRLAMRDQKGWDRANQIQLAACTENNPDPIQGTVENGLFTDLASFQTFYRGNTNYPQPVQAASPAEDVLVALGKFDAELQELQSAVITRPQSRFPINYANQVPFDILLPHLSPLRQIAFVVSLRATARLELGRVADAFADARFGIRLADTIANEPFLVDHLTRLEILNSALQTIREGFFRHSWNDAQLAQFEKDLAPIKLVPGLKNAFRGERAGCIGMLDYFRRQGFGAPNVENIDHDAALIFRFMPGGWHCQNMVTIGGFYEQFALGAVDEADRIHPDITAGYERAGRAGRLSPYAFALALFAPAVDTALLKTGRAQTFSDACRVACAIERYRLAEGRLPESLELLVPRFLAAIPADVIGEQALRYLPGLDGSYVIYSVGWNEVDDHGTTGRHDQPHGPIDYRQGDWVWKMPARK